jgi:hypothetical protein
MGARFESELARPTHRFRGREFTTGRRKEQDFFEKEDEETYCD